MEGLYVDIRSLLDETTQKRYHERIGGEYMGKSGVINQDFKGEDNTAYHDVIRLFKIYRSVNWRMQIKVNQVKHRVQEEYGTNLDEFLDHIYQAGMDINQDLDDMNFSVLISICSHNQLVFHNILCKLCAICTDCCITVQYKDVIRILLYHKFK